MTDALKELTRQEAVYAYCFEGKRYDVGDKLGYLQANIEFTLKRDDLRDDFITYLSDLRDRSANLDFIH